MELIEIKKLSSNQLQEMLSELTQISTMFDPFTNANDEKFKTLLNKYQISNDLDPYSITNRLLMLLDQTQEELNQRLH